MNVAVDDTFLCKERNSAGEVDRKVDNKDKKKKRSKKRTLTDTGKNRTAFRQGIISNVGHGVVRQEVIVGDLRI